MKNIIAVILAFALGLFVGLKRGSRTEYYTIVDTITNTKIIHHQDTIVKDNWYSMPMLVYKKNIDTLYISKDSALVREQKEYCDSSYIAWVSGIDVRMDSINTWNKLIYICDTIQQWQYIYTDRVKKQKRWGIGLQGGYGITNGKLSPYIGIGVHYNLFHF